MSPRPTILAILLAGACSPDGGSSDAGAGAASLALAIRPHGAPAGLDLVEASASFEEIRLVSDSGEDLETSGAVDLLADETLLEIAGARPGLYSRVRFRLGPEKEETLRVEAGLGGTDVVLRAEEDDEIDLRCPVGERLDPGGRLRIEVGVDRGRWFAGVDLPSAEVEDGVALLDPDDGPNRELAERAIESVLGSFAITATTLDGAAKDESGDHRDGGVDAGDDAEGSGDGGTGDGGDDGPDDDGPGNDGPEDGGGD